MNRSPKQNINKETLILNNTLDQMDLIYIGHSTQKENTHSFFNCTGNILQDIEHTLGHKTNLSNFKPTEIMSSIFSNHNPLRLKINYNEKIAKNTNKWRLNYANKQPNESLKK